MDVTVPTILPVLILVGAAGLALLGGAVGDAARGLLRGAGYAVLTVAAVAGVIYAATEGGATAGVVVVLVILGVIAGVIGKGVRTA